MGRVGLPTAPTNGRTGGTRENPDGGARTATSIYGVYHCHASSLWPTTCSTPPSGGHCLLRLSPEGTYQKELPGGHVHFKLVASTPTIKPGVEAYERLIGGKPVVSVTLAGQTLDSGSQVSFVTETFFKRAIQPQRHELHSARNWLTIPAADGLEVPYVGYFETDVCVAGHVVADRAILVVRDAGQSLPGLLGMNVLAYIPRFAASISHLVVPDGTKFARVAARLAVCVPAQTRAYVRVVGGFQGQTALLEPMATGCGPLLVTSAVVQGTVYFAGMVNPTEKDFWVQPGTRIGIVQPAEVLPPKDTGIIVNANEIVVGTKSVVPTTSELSQLPIDLTAFEGTDQELQDVEALFTRHRSVFASSNNDLGCTGTVQHHIRTTDDIPVTMPYRRIPPTQLAEVKSHLQELVQSGAIVPSDSAYASAIVLVRKKTGALRMCCDFRALNAKTVKDAYPLPRIDESMDALAGARYFSTLDLQSAYMQVPMHPGDAHKTPFGLCEHRRMAFGLCNAPATFQRLMQTAFRDEMFNTLLCYLHDLLVFSRTISEHIRRLDTVFMR